VEVIAAAANQRIDQCTSIDGLALAVDDLVRLGEQRPVLSTAREIDEHALLAHAWANPTQ
jgi:hypothetical protein